ncbi:ATP-binding protein [Streptomyces chromofuscus]|uniref:ATP-binding protein n=1 Tax=Streptomyces chromofuscus TaxID=42881 RepID=A0A7M2TCA3_STRCW|nr:ATP-binding protein [Streptomyces chromofuscus]QOV44961.1 ATP-binding protein [Streptomyces chromofuscus]GGT28828.1 ATPase [Streptomyces chromofuscus]
MSAQQWTQPAGEPADQARPGRSGTCRPADVRRAVRHAVACRCRATGTRCDEEALSDALLVASELTSNAILHGGGVTGVDVDVVGHEVRVSVCDRSDRLPVAVAPVDEQGRRRAGGRGWPIVCRLSCDVRVADLPTGGKRITAAVPVF